MRTSVLFLVSFLLFGCSLVRPYRPPTKAKKTVPSTVAAPSPAPKPPSTWERTKVLTARIDEAIALDGHPNGKEIARRVASCKEHFAFPGKCAEKREALSKESRAAVAAGLAVKAVNEQKFEDAEPLVQQAEVFAKEDGARRKKEAEIAAAERAAIEDELVACEKNRTPCNDRCKDGHPASCVAVGFMLLSEKNYDTGEALFARACHAGFQSGCEWLTRSAATKKKDLQAIEDAWSNVRTIGDDLAMKKFMLTTAQQNFGRPRNVRAAGMMAEHIAAATREEYCPAVAEFVSLSTRAEFQARSKAHCQDEAPSATGLSGEQVELRAQCQTVFATPCSPK